MKDNVQLLRMLIVGGNRAQVVAASPESKRARVGTYRPAKSLPLKATGSFKTARVARSVGAITGAKRVPMQIPMPEDSTVAPAGMTDQEDKHFTSF